MTRLGRYLEGRWLLVALLTLVATGGAAAQAGGLASCIRAAIDDGIAQGDESLLTELVIVYLGVNAAGWALQSILIRGLAGIGQGIVPGPQPRPVQASDGAVAALLLRAAGGLDHRPADQRRQRRVRRPVPGPAHPGIEHRAAADHGRRAVHRQLASWAWSRSSSCRRRWCSRGGFRRRRRWRGFEVRKRIATVTAQVGPSVSGMAMHPGLQPRAHIPGAVRRAERRQPQGQRLRPEAVLGVLPGDRADGRDLDRRRAGDRLPACWPTAR